jgi:hypothetical protein
MHQPISSHFALMIRSRTVTVFRSVLAAVLLTFLALAATATAQVPQMISYQGRVAVGGVNFTGTGLFKFALVNGTYGGLPGETAIYWSNDGSLSTVNAAGVPTASVTVPCDKGLYSVLLGNPDSGMVPLNAGAFGGSDVRLRVWFSDGVNGFQLLTPDQRIASVAYAMFATNATTIPDASVNSLKLADGAVTAGKLAANSVTNTNLVDSSVTASKIGFASVNSDKILDGSIATADLQDGAVATADLATGAVTGAKIANLAVTSAHLAAGAVTTTQLLDGTIATADFADFSITNAKIATGAITSAKISPLAVGTAEMADASVTTAKIAAGAITSNEIATAAIQNIDLAYNIINTGEIIDGAVQTADLANLAVTTAKVANAAIGTAQLQDDSITVAKLATLPAVAVSLATSVQFTPPNYYESGHIPVAWDTEKHDTSNMFRPGDPYHFFAPVKGIYRYTFQVETYGGGYVTGWARLSKNDEDLPNYQTSWDIPESSPGGGSYELLLNANDSLKLIVVLTRVNDVSYPMGLAASNKRCYSSLSLVTPVP